jgi:ABC-type polysaccharide/polyol phosphate transport system ATPase subunit
MTAIIQGQDIWKEFSLAGQGSRSLKDTVVGMLTGRKAPAGASSFTALKGINFEVNPGDFFGVIGTNGSGKSTLLKIMAGIAKPTRGSIRVEGRVSALLELGAGFHSDFTGRENVFMYGTVLGLDKKVIAERFDSIVDFAELWEFIDQPVRTYSSGMYMRLAFAIAVNVDPDILIIDEILAVGDAGFQKKCFERIDAFRAAGKTIVFVSHDHGTIEKFCNKVLWLDRGVPKAYGDARTVISGYLEQLAEAEDRRHGQASEKALADATRHGSGECRITEATLVDDADAEKHTWRTGSDVTIRVRYEATEAIVDPVVGFGVFRSDGVHIYGSNTDLDKVTIDALPAGQGEIRIRLPELGLLPGTYALDLAIHERGNGYRAYDYLQRCVEFSMIDNRSDVGAVRLPHTWEVTQVRTEELSNHT